jgi:hypothetical protein
MTSGAWFFVAIAWIVILSACGITLSSLLKHSK